MIFTFCMMRISLALSDFCTILIPKWINRSKQKGVSSFAVTLLLMGSPFQEATIMIPVQIFLVEAFLLYSPILVIFLVLFCLRQGLSRQSWLSWNQLTICTRLALNSDTAASASRVLGLKAHAETPTFHLCVCMSVQGTSPFLRKWKTKADVHYLLLLLSTLQVTTRAEAWLHVPQHVCGEHKATWCSPLTSIFTWVQGIQQDARLGQQELLPVVCSTRPSCFLRQQLSFNLVLLLWVGMPGHRFPESHCL